MEPLYPHLPSTLINISTLAIIVHAYQVPDCERNLRGVEAGLGADLGLVRRPRGGGALPAGASLPEGHVDLDPSSLIRAM